jgi:hypothetical protein
MLIWQKTNGKKVVGEGVGGLPEVYTLRHLKKTLSYN